MSDRRFALDEELVFEGSVLTVPGGPVPVSMEARRLCVIFENGMTLVSGSHRMSPLVTGAIGLALEMGYTLCDPVAVSPDIIAGAYRYAGGQSRHVVRLDQNAIRRRIEKILEDAARLGASDIHVETGDAKTSVQVTVHGQMTVLETLTAPEGQQLMSSIFTHCEVPSGVTEDTWQPQAGMLSPMPEGEMDSGMPTPDRQIRLPESVSGVRCQWMPLAGGGRYLVMRLHYHQVIRAPSLPVSDSGTAPEGRHDGNDPVSAWSSLAGLGYEGEQIVLMERVRMMPSGLRIMGGPTNHGKTTSNRVLLEERVRETGGKLNLLQIEDPPESRIPGARQIGISVNNDSHARQDAFAAIMRATLRLAPDMVMLGEIRDPESAAFAMRLALVGSQIYTTLHVHGAIAIPKRLVDLGVPSWLVHDHHLLVALMNQRLVPRLCMNCRIPLRESSAEVKILPAIEAALELALGETTLLDGMDLSRVCLARQGGCPSCSEGRHGRTVVAEIILPDGPMMKLLENHDHEGASRYWMKEMSGATWWHYGLLKLLRGEIDPRDFERILGPLLPHGKTGKEGWS